VSFILGFVLGIPDRPEVGYPTWNTVPSSRQIILWQGKACSSFVYSCFYGDMERLKPLDRL